MSRALLIANPAAARTEPQAVAAIRAVFRAAGWDVDVVATSGPGHARRLAEEGVAAQVDVVAVFGGDGTTMQAASALVGSDVPLGVMPGGTGNLLAGNLRIPASPARAAEALVRGRARPLDLGAVERDDGLHYFAVACGAGYDARVMAGTGAEEKRRWGMLAYTVTTLRLLRDLESGRYLITVDGKEYEAHAAMVLVANCSEVIPPFVRMGPGIRPDDGLLDVVVVQANNLLESIRAAWGIVLSRWVVPGSGLVAWARGAEIRVEPDRTEPVQLDGEAAGATPFVARVVPGAIRVIAPAP